MPAARPAGDRPPAANPVRSALNWWFRDRTTGRITIYQTPNIPLLVFIVAFMSRRVFETTGAVDVVLAVIATASLAIWGADEVARGVNPWRRVLGGVVLIALLAGLLRS
jgi:hypothetical protein